MIKSLLLHFICLFVFLSCQNNSSGADNELNATPGREETRTERPSSASELEAKHFRFLAYAMLKNASVRFGDDRSGPSSSREHSHYMGECGSLELYLNEYASSDCAHQCLEFEENERGDSYVLERSCGPGRLEGTNCSLVEEHREIRIDQNKVLWKKEFANTLIEHELKGVFTSNQASFELECRLSYRSAFFRPVAPQLINCENSQGFTCRMGDKTFACEQILAYLRQIRSCSIF